MKRFTVVIVAFVMAVFLVGGCLDQERRATLYAVGRNMPDCVENSVYVNDDATYLTYKTKRGRIRYFDVKWEDGQPKLVEFFM